MIFKTSSITVLKLIIISYVIEYNKVIGKYEYNKQSLIYDHPYEFENSYQYKSDLTKTKKAQTTVKNDIRRAFQPMKVKEDVLNYMIEIMCKRLPEDPVYIFKMPMPEHNYQNLIMHRSEFEIPIYPNLTDTHMQLAKLSKRIDLDAMPKPSLENSINWFQKYPIVFDDDISDNEESVSIDGELQNEIVKANTVTETNFINYVLKINDKGEKYLRQEEPTDFQNINKDYYYSTYSSSSNLEKHKIKQPPRKLTRNSYGEPKIKVMKNYLNNPKIDLTELGVNSESFYQPEYKYSTATTINEDRNKKEDNYENNYYEINKNIFDSHMQGDYGFFDKTEKNSVWDLPGKLSSKPLKMHDKHVVESNDFLKNITILLTKESKPHWDLTARKESHKDLDVYIARANDPFGHSTRWKLRNQLNQSVNSIDIRKKRGIKELYSMIKCSTGCDPLIYKGYGCYCGFMGSGTPVDGIDRCCKKHDECYTRSNCPSYLEYFIPFLWKCYKGKPLCAYSHGEWGGPRSCASQLCQCDLVFSRCLRKFSCPRKRAVCKSSYVRMIQNYLMIK